MKSLISIEDIDLNPLAGKKYWNSTTPWQEDIIYFLLVDRFHDSHLRKPIKGEERSKGFGTIEELQTICGGTLKGISKNLSYIKKLGCTAIWLSPVFENNPQSYHGYAIQNFLKIDPRFGTKKDLQQLIEKAHKFNLKVFLDVVLNHSGDNWFYNSPEELLYNKGKEYPFGAWRKEGLPIPIELRNTAYYKRKGMIQNWDTYPETREGDFFSLKKFNHDESREGLDLQEVLIKIHSYWIKETDCDGFRIDAAKHMGELPVARFCTKIKEYTSLLGKSNFFIFGEIPADDKTTARFFEPSLSEYEKRIYHGVDSLFDFPLHYILSKVIKGNASFEKISKRYEYLQSKTLTKNKEVRHLVNFVDNHDQVEANMKQRFGAGAHEKQIIGGIGILLTLPGVPCVYYGTEQGFQGEGEGDAWVREAMFNAHDKKENVLNKKCRIYKEMARIITVRKNEPALNYGRITFPEISEDGMDFNSNNTQVCLFTRRLFNENVIIAYNKSADDKVVIFMRLRREDAEVKSLKYLYGDKGTIKIFGDSSNERPYNDFRLELSPMQFVILK